MNDNNDLKFADTTNVEDLPLNQSMSGKNAYYFWCDHYEGRTNYAVCLHTILAEKQERRNLRTECKAPIACGSCPAIKMRLEEQKAGKSLYYVDREKQYQEFISRPAIPPAEIRYGKRNGAGSGLPLNTTRVTDTEFRHHAERLQERQTVIKPAPKQTEINTDLIGEAINKAIQESQ